MVNKVFTKEELEEAIYGKSAVELVLTNEEVEDLKRNGMFKFIRNQLEYLPSLTFGCTESDGICSYYFILDKSDNEDLINRIVNMLYLLTVKKEKKKLTECSVSEIMRASRIRVSGEARVCNLF